MSIERDGRERSRLKLFFANTAERRGKNIRAYPSPAKLDCVGGQGSTCGLFMGAEDKQLAITSTKSLIPAGGERGCG